MDTYDLHGGRCAARKATDRALAFHPDRSTWWKNKRYNNNLLCTGCLRLSTAGNPANRGPGRKFDGRKFYRILNVTWDWLVLLCDVCFFSPPPSVDNYSTRNNRFLARIQVGKCTSLVIFFVELVVFSNKSGRNVNKSEKYTVFVIFNFAFCQSLVKNRHRDLTFSQNIYFSHI